MQVDKEQVWQPGIQQKPAGSHAPGRTPQPTRLHPHKLKGTRKGKKNPQAFTKIVSAAWGRQIMNLVQVNLTLLQQILEPVYMLHS